jgi:hypothetical protein
METNSRQIVSRVVAGACVVTGTGWVLTLMTMLRKTPDTATGESSTLRLLWALLLVALIAKVYASLLGRAVGRHVKDPRRVWGSCLVLSLIWLGVLQPWNIHGVDAWRLVTFAGAAASLVFATMGLLLERSPEATPHQG